MTQLTDLMNKGYNVLVSPHIEPDTVFSWNEPEAQATMIFHPLNYNYIAYEPFRAHELNMAWIQENVIDRMADEALARLNTMVDHYNRRNEPRVITFLPNVEVTELDDGSFSFFVKPVYAGEDPGVGMVFDTGQDGYKTYQQLQKELNREPTFDEMIKG